MDSDKLITTSQAAAILGVTRGTVVKLCDDGRLPYGRPGGSHRYLREADVLEYKAEITHDVVAFAKRSASTANTANTVANVNARIAAVQRVVDALNGLHDLDLRAYPHHSRPGFNVRDVDGKWIAAVTRPDGNAWELT